MARELKREGHTVFGLSRKKIDSADYPTLVYDGSPLSLRHVLNETRPDIVFHLAALFIAEHRFDQIDELLKANLIFSTQLVDAMLAVNCRKLVCAGTSWQNFAGTEGTASCLYAATKQAFESILKFYVDAHKLQAVVLKIYDTYGANDPRRKLLSILRDAAHSHKPIGLSPGDQEIDLLHVDDAAQAFVKAIEQFDDSNKGFLRDFYLRGEKAMTLKQLVELINEVSSHPVQAQWGERNYRAREVMQTWKKGTTLPGWIPRISLKQGLKDYFKSGDSNV